MNPRTTPRCLLRSAFAATAAAALVTILLSCGGRAIGYGLLLWAEPESPFSTGEVLRVVQESSIQKAYLVTQEGRKELADVPTARMRLFATNEQARAAAEAYAEFLDVYGYSSRDGLPIREQPDPESRRVYRLRAGQLVKVVSRGEEQVEIAGYRNYWYQVLTEDGFEGHCFGAYLPVFSAAADPHAEVERLRALDPALDILVSTDWRPEYFQEMAARGRVDLVRFSPEIGLFVDQQTQTVRMVTHRSRQSVEYSAIENVGPNRYVFVSADGATDLRAHLQSPERLVLTLTRSGQVVSVVYVAFRGDIEGIITAERERRQGLFEGFLERGGTLSSTAYGTITLQPGMRFLWEGFGRLQEMAFSKTVQGAGTVDFPYRLSAPLADRHDGVISFRFREYGPEELTSFLYRFDAGGVRLEFLQPANVRDLEAIQTEATSVVIYFSFGGS